MALLETVCFDIKITPDFVQNFIKIFTHFYYCYPSNPLFQKIFCTELQKINITQIFDRIKNTHFLNAKMDLRDH